MPKATPEKSAEKTPRLSVLERRLQNPFGEPSGKIAFKRPDITGRWFNDARTGQVYHAKRDLGWVPVTPDMIEDLGSVGAHDVSAAGQITRGERGQEVLMYMPTADFKQIQMAKTRVNLEKMRDTKGEQGRMLEAFSKKGFDADAVGAHVKTIGAVTDDVERVPLTEREG